VAPAQRDWPEPIERVEQVFYEDRVVGNAAFGTAIRNLLDVTFTVFPPYTAGAPQRPSGLLGPVRIITATK